MDRIKKIRELFESYCIDGYIIPSSDEYMNEYVPNHLKRLEYITGFSGSNGIAIILLNKTILITDGRYLDQALTQMPDADIYDQKDLYKDNIKNLILKRTAHDISCLNFGYDSKLFTELKLKMFDSINLKSISDNLVDCIWENRPSFKGSNIYEYPIDFAGETYKSKVKKCRDYLSMNSLDSFLITELDSICWLLNLRGQDVEFTPLILGRLLITQTSLQLFTKRQTISRDIDEGLKSLRPDVEFISEDLFEEELSKLKGTIALDKRFASCYIIDLCCRSNLNIKHLVDPCILPKACKNPTEINRSIDVHIQDAVAVCELLSYIDYSDRQDLAKLSEYDLSEKLTKYRKQRPGYIYDSFPTICGFNENGAIIHYKPLKDKAKYIVGDGILLIDSGGQYMGGTTDITRTICIGKPTLEQRKRYTQILRGHINLAFSIFPRGTKGANLDILARQFLWQDLMDYNHGTGHGVGNFLNVHEGPQAINLNNTTELKAGMIISNEPGYYKSKHYGMRIENLIYVDKIQDSEYLKFINLTLVPYDNKLIDYALLTNFEKQSLDTYYNQIYNKIYHLLSDIARTWLMNVINKK
ncbi:MAG: aminopeptidase P family protein [Rickettsiaceae bacterium]